MVLGELSGDTKDIIFCLYYHAEPKVGGYRLLRYDKIPYARISMFKATLCRRYSLEDKCMTQRILSVSRIIFHRISPVQEFLIL
jgi:hypothetical protein